MVREPIARSIRVATIRLPKPPWMHEYTFVYSFVSCSQSYSGDRSFTLHTRATGEELNELWKSSHLQYVEELW
jgi:hypothetical protein